MTLTCVLVEGLMKGHSVHEACNETDLRVKGFGVDMWACLEAAGRLAARLALVLSSSKSRASMSSSVTKLPGTALQGQAIPSHDMLIAEPTPSWYDTHTHPGQLSMHFYRTR